MWLVGEEKMLHCTENTWGVILKSSVPLIQASFIPGILRYVNLQSAHNLLAPAIYFIQNEFALNTLMVIECEFIWRWTCLYAYTWSFLLIVWSAKISRPPAFSDKLKTLNKICTCGNIYCDIPTFTRLIYWSLQLQFVLKFVWLFWCNNSSQQISWNKFSVFQKWH